MIVKMLKELKKLLENTYKDYVTILVNYGSLLDREKQ